jgi:putative intracellular protease/amidase
MLRRTKRLKEVENEDFNAVYLAGGHGTMYDFPDNAVLQNMIVIQYEKDKMVAAICYGVGGLIK